VTTANHVLIDGEYYAPNHPRVRGVIQGRTEAVSPSPPKAKRIRQDSKPLLNKLEQEFFDYLTAEYDVENLRAQAITYRIGNGVRFTPDLTGHIWNPPAEPHFTAWEVKGKHAWDDALVKLKVAAGLYPEIDWILVWKENGEWKEQRVLP
jgi:hypothetical protein